jgi:hypothetical protein
VPNVGVNVVNMQFDIQFDPLHGAVVIVRRHARPVAAQVQRRARETLRQYLSDTQRQTLDDHLYFDLVGSAGNHYRIYTKYGYSGNVFWISPEDTEMARGRYCAHLRIRDPNGRLVPLDDHFLGQFLTLVADENAWLNLANIFEGEFPPTYPGREGRGSNTCACEGCQRALELPT